MKVTHLRPCPKRRSLPKRSGTARPKQEKCGSYWGVNGWKHVPESLRPPMTVIKDGVMHTPMAGKNDLFVATIAVHTGTIINYGFLTTKDRTNEAVRVWQGDGPSKDFSTVAKSDGTVEIPSTTAGAAPSPSSSKVSDRLLVTQEIRYRTIGVDKAWFVWGVNGWQPMPEDSRPPGTTIRNNVMHTPMIDEEQDFVIKIHVPSGTMLNYGFLSAIGSMKFWQDNAGQDYQTMADTNGSIDIESTVIVSNPGAARKPFKVWPYVLVIAVLIAGGVILLVLRHPPSRNSVRIVCYNLAFLLLGLLVIELVFGRWINPHTLHLLNVPRNVELSFDVSHLYASPNTVVTYRRDQYGLRGQFDHPSSIDILTVGGSTTDQRSLDEGSTWQDILREGFKSHGKEIQASSMPA